MNTNDKNIVADLITKILAEDQEDPWKNGGIVVSVEEGIAKIEGLKQAILNEQLIFENGLLGFVYEINEYFVSALIINEKFNNKVTINSLVQQTGHLFSVPVGNFVGRVLDPICNPVDGLGDLKVDGTNPVDIIPVAIIDRAPIKKPLYTGITVIDAVIPLGRGQRSIIIGDMKTGKTTIGIDAIINQKNFYNSPDEVHCIYVAIGQKQQDTKRVVEELKQRDGLKFTTVIMADSFCNAATIYIAPYVATALAEHLCNTYEKDVFIVYDDLSKHAVAYRTIELILRKPPGRESFPAGVFYLHARLLERSGAFNNGKTITSFSVLETQEGNMESYINTNAISITDGQLVLSKNLFYEGTRPAIDIGKSVSRIGSSAQEGLLKEVSKQLKLGLMKYEDLLSYSKIIQDLDPLVQSLLKKGSILKELIKQKSGESRSAAENAIIIIAANHDLLNNAQDIHKTFKNIVNYFNNNHKDLMKNIVQCKNISTQEAQSIILDILKNNNALIV
jgi:F-type H+-transporting ATPase subunit alpha